ncbi:hypothetical protein BJ878DRAFT_79617 [Calycina marina]|uniref:Uncharacterized protein n=1 Tax=Calycina marina TaxID=1763456 RepID=A0A9P7Z2T6_9HELO|nr:hypothetical protein BJ878DRAFT_79617 [Calycina marina]
MSLVTISASLYLAGSSTLRINTADVSCFRRSMCISRSTERVSLVVCSQLIQYVIMMFVLSVNCCPPHGFHLAHILGTARCIKLSQGCTTSQHHPIIGMVGHRGPFCCTNYMRKF